MNKKLLLGIILGLALIHGTAVLAATPEFEGQIRYRFEMDGKDFNTNTQYTNYSLLRSRFAAMFAPTDHVSAFIRIQDSRVYGEETNTLTDGSADKMDVQQAYFHVKDLYGYPWDLKIGRMEAQYGNERLLGAVGWSNIGRSFDGVVLKYRYGKTWVDVFNFKEVELGSAGDVGDQNVYGAYSHVDFAPGHTSQAFLIWQRTKPKENLDRYTAGLYLDNDLGMFRHEVEFAYQGGTYQNMDVKAMMAALNVGLEFENVSMTPEITAGVDYLSGDDNMADNSYEVFSTLYATNHNFYGAMDYFTDIPANTMGLGLMDIHFGLAGQVHPDVGLSARYHLLNGVKNYTLASGSDSKEFGNEVDVCANLKYSEYVSFEGGLSFYFPGEVFKETMGADPSTWIYFMSVVDF